METYLIIHHSAGGKNETIQTIRDLHKPKYGRVFYQSVIDRDANIWREHNKLNYRGWLKNSVDICVLGDFTKDEPTGNQLNALHNLIMEKRAQYNFTKETTHNEAPALGLKATSSACPGSLMSWYNDYIIDTGRFEPENKMVDEAKLVQITNEILFRDPTPDERKKYLNSNETDVRIAIGASEERKRLIVLINSAKHL